MAGIPPWLAGPDVIGAMSRGAQLGLEQRRESVSESEAADRLKMAYEQMANEERRASELQKYRADQAAMALIQKQQQAEMLNAYRMGQLEVARQKADDLADHYAAMEEKNNAAASIVTHDEFPGVKFLKQPSGHEQVINSGELSPSQKLEHTERAYNMMKMGPQELANDPSYSSRTNAANAILQAVGAIPRSPLLSTNAPSKKFKLLSIDGKPVTDSNPSMDNASDDEE